MATFVYLKGLNSVPGDVTGLEKFFWQHGVGGWNQCQRNKLEIDLKASAVD